MMFSLALEWLRDGMKVRRKAWKSMGTWIRISKPSEHSIVTEPFIVMRTSNDELLPWAAAHSCLLANDWEIVD